MDNMQEGQVESNIDAGFLEYFNSQISPKLDEVEENRTKIFIFQKFGIGVFLFQILVLVVFIICEPGLFFKVTTGVSLLIVLTIATIVIFSPIYKYKENLKASFYDTLFSYLGEFQYMNEDKRNDKAYWRNINMLRKDFNNTPRVDDYIKGIYKGIPVEIEELKLTETIRRDNHKQTKTIFYGLIKDNHEPTKTIFNGLILTIPQLKKVNSSLIVRDKSSAYTRNQGQAVLLEDIEFNDIFETSSDDQIEARYMLTPAFMEYLKTLHNKGIIVTCCFQDEKIYIAVRTDHNMFEVSIKKSAFDVGQYYKIIKEFEDILKIIDILKLDQKAVL